MIANNVINNAGSQAIVIAGEDSQGRTSNDINIINNTATDSTKTGNFLRIYGWASNITLENNVWITPPDLTIGTYSTAPVFTANADLSSFSKISGNVWPAPANIPTWAQGGINYIAVSGPNGYQTPAEWNSMSEVGTDIFQNVTLGDSYQVQVGSVIAGAAMKVAA
jgi:hypothetical protein